MRTGRAPEANTHARPAGIECKSETEAIGRLIPSLLRDVEVPDEDVEVCTESE